MWTVTKTLFFIHTSSPFSAHHMRICPDGLLALTRSSRLLPSWYLLLSSLLCSPGHTGRCASFTIASEHRRPLHNEVFSGHPICNNHCQFCQHLMLIYFPTWHFPLSPSHLGIKMQVLSMNSFTQQTCFEHLAYARHYSRSLWFTANKTYRGLPSRNSCPCCGVEDFLNKHNKWGHTCLKVMMLEERK